MVDLEGGGAIFVLAGVFELMSERRADDRQEGVAESAVGVRVFEHRAAVQLPHIVRPTSARCSGVKNPCASSMSSHGLQ
jgi:hypothetical protein